MADGRSFPGLCDVCLAPAAGHLERAGDRGVDHVTECRLHGTRRWRISDNGDDYLRYDHAYHALFPADRPPPQPMDTYFLVHEGCNQACDYCLTEANRHHARDDYSAADLARDLSGLRTRKIALVGGEPTLHPELLELVARIAASGRTTVLLTNGLTLADRAFLDRIHAASQGRLVVRVTFEGFEAEDYEHLRVARAHASKLRALENLEARGVSVTLGHTISDAEQHDRARLHRVMASLIRYAMDHRHVTGVTFSALAALGAARKRVAADVLSVDGVMDRIVDAMPFAVPRREAYVTQRLIHALASALQLPLCEYRQAVALFQGTRGWEPLHSWMDIAALEARLDASAAVWPASRAARLLRLASDVAACTRPSRVPDVARVVRDITPLFLGSLDYREIPRSVLPINAGTVCDRYNYDATVARRCEKANLCRTDGVLRQETTSGFILRELRARESPVAAIRARR